MHITMLDVGQGECFLLDFPDGSFAVMDAGPASSADLVVARVAHRIERGGRFRWAAATQWDADHIGGFPALLSQYEPEEFVSPALDLGQMELLLGAVDPSSPARRAVSRLYAALRKSRVHQTPAFARLEVPECGPFVKGWYLSPDRAVGDELSDNIRNGTVSSSRLRALGNRSSLVVIMSVFGLSILFPGEIEADQYETARVQFEKRRHPSAAALRSHVIKLSHHGAERNNPVELFQYFCAAGVIGLSSAGGRYGHPSPITIRHLHAVSGGRQLCTGLGQPCNEMISGRQVNDGEFGWARSLDWRSIPSPGRKCHGDVTLQITPAGKIVVVTEAEASHCPFGSGLVAISRSKAAKRSRRMR